MDIPDNRTPALRQARKEMKHIVRLKNQPWRWAVGVRSGVAMGFPIALFTVLGHAQLGMIAMLGAFTAMYCPALDQRDRLRVLPYVALALVLCSMLGVAFSFSTNASILCLIGVTAVSSTLCQGIGMPPPGTVFFVLLTAVSSRLATLHVRTGDLVAPWWIPLLVAAGAVGALLAGSVTWLLFRARSIPSAEPALRPSFKWFHLDRGSTIVTIRMTVGVTLACFTGSYLGALKSYWVVLPVVAILQMGHNRRLTITRGVQRIIGTLLGVGLFALLLQLPDRPAAFMLKVMFLQFATDVVITRNYALGLFFITALALIIATVGPPLDPAVVIRDRVIDTVMGIGIAVLVYVISEWLEGWRARNALQGE